MQIATTLDKPTRWKDRAGHLASALVVLFLLMDGVSKWLLIAPVVEASAQLGYPASVTRGIGTMVLTCAVPTSEAPTSPIPTSPTPTSLGLI